MLYNQRTAACIDKWCAGSGISLLYLRVVKAVYKAAWRDAAFKLDCGSSPLRVVRDYRSMEWWQTHCFLTTQAKRRKLGTYHRHGGAQKCSWEHVFVEVWGIHWRSRLSACTSLAKWMSGFQDFAEQLCHKWSLPQPVGNQGPKTWGDPFITIKLATNVDDVPPLLPNPKADSWDSKANRLWIQTDNQQLEQIFAGRSLLESDFLRPVCIRIGRNLHSLLEKSWRPRLDVSNFIEWDGRQYNSIADHCANIALDKGSDWHVLDDESLNAAGACKLNLRLCADGALRGTGQAAAGMCLLAYGEDGVEMLLYRAGKVLGELSSAFVSEILAMEWCLDVFFVLMNR